MVDPRSLAVYAQGAVQGAATFVRLEGCWWGDQAVYFTSTNGGDKLQGQIWEYRPGEGEHQGALTLVYETHDSDVMSMPDNITFTPQGSLIGVRLL
jgi:secreted PhoX family phosphatase